MLLHIPGGSWKRLTTLFSGVLKKAAAMELYSPSAQKSCRVERKDTEGEMAQGGFCAAEGSCTLGLESTDRIWPQNIEPKFKFG